MQPVSCFILLLFLCPYLAGGNQISFLKYCLNGTDPELISAHGERSSGSIVMNSNHGSDPWYFPDLNCTVTLNTQNDFYIFLTFSNISLRNSSMDNLTVIYNNDNSNVILAGQQVCSNENCEGLKFDSGEFSNMTLKFISANVSVPLNVTGFIAHYTVYDFANPNNGACRGKHRFLCENKHCIWYDLVCDGHNNCGDFSDEAKCIIPVKSTVWGIIVIIIAIITVVILVPLFCCLATYGTRSIVKSVTIPNEPTPLLNTVGEGSNLLTSSGAVTQCWPGSSSERSSFTYGSADCSTETEVRKKPPSVSGINDLGQNRFL